MPLPFLGSFAGSHFFMHVPYAACVLHVALESKVITAHEGGTVLNSCQRTLISLGGGNLHFAYVLTVLALRISLQRLRLFQQRLTPQPKLSQGEAPLPGTSCDHSGSLRMLWVASLLQACRHGSFLTQRRLHLQAVFSLF